MKNERALALAFGLLGALGCATPAVPRPPAPRAYEIRGGADGLRVEHEYRPAPTGADAHVAAFEHPPRAYYAACWDYGYYSRGGWGRRWDPCRPAHRRCD